MPKFEIPRSNPIGEFLHGGGHPFPERIEELVRMIDVIDEEHLLPFMNTAHDWEGGRELERGEKELLGRLAMIWRKDVGTTEPKHNERPTGPLPNCPSCKTKLMGGDTACPTCGYNLARPMADIGWCSRCKAYVHQNNPEDKSMWESYCKFCGEPMDQWSL